MIKGLWRWLSAAAIVSAGVIGAATARGPACPRPQ